MNHAIAITMPFGPRPTLRDMLQSFWDKIRQHMAITAAVCESFKTEVLQALHNFTASTGHTFKVALYSSSATLNASTTNYSTTNEITGVGYSAGGTVTTSSTPVASTGGTGVVALCDFTDVSWTTATITARGALIYNSSASNRGVQVLDFGSDQTSTAGTFTIVFPVPARTTAILRLN